MKTLAGIVVAASLVVAMTPATAGPTLPPPPPLPLPTLELLIRIEPACFMNESDATVVDCMSGCNAAANDLAVLFEHSNSGGSCVHMYSNEEVISCDRGTWIVSATSFNDIISSAELVNTGSTGCTGMTLWENQGFTGLAANCGSGCSYVGDTLNDKTSSYAVCKSSGGTYDCYVAPQ